MAKTSRKRLYGGNSNLVKLHSAFAEQWLKNFQAAGKAPKKMSGVLNLRMGEFVLMFQYDRDRLVGCVAVHVNNAENAATKLVECSIGPDLAKVLSSIDEKVEKAYDESSDNTKN